MIIRHAEKPGDTEPDHGVSISGSHDRHDLTVRGWQRAGALVRFFAPVVPLSADAPVSTPRSVFASAATARSPSLRAKHTVKPLAAMLGVPVEDRFVNGDEAGVAAAALAAPSPVLIAWHHNYIVRLARAIGGGALGCPDDWPDDRFDMVWVLDRADSGGWSFTVVAQRLLPQDCG